MKLKLTHIAGTHIYSISKVDIDGNGIIVLSGKLGGSDFLSPAETEPRLKVLEEMVAAWNEHNKACTE